MTDKLEDLTWMAIMTMSSKSERRLSDDDIRDLARFTPYADDPEALIEAFQSEWDAKHSDEGLGEVFDSQPFDPSYGRL